MSEFKEQALARRVESRQDRRVRDKLRIIGTTALGTVGGAIAIATQVSANDAASHLASYFALVGVKALPTRVLGMPVDVAGLLVALLCLAAALVWLLWPQKAPAPAPSAAPPQPIVIEVRHSPEPRSPPRSYAPPADGKYIVGGRAEDEPGKTIGPMPTAEALKYWKEPASEFMPLDEAAAWLYAHAPAGLRAVLQDYRPFASITANAAAHIGTAADDGIGGFYARRERGFPLEPLKYKDSLRAWPARHGRPDWKGSLIDPSVKRADLPLFLEYYANAVPAPVIDVRRDKDLREGVGWIVFKEWGHTPETSGGGRLSDFGAAWPLIHQAARDGDVTIWGKPGSPANLFEEIPQEFWRDHNVDFLRLWYPSSEVQTRTTANGQRAVGTYIELMVSSSEFENVWPKP